jgi:uncharacterized protein YndB with AHSA1/START domain
MNTSSTLKWASNAALRAVTVRVSRQFRASPECIFDAWLDPDEARAFLFANTNGDVIHPEMDARVGGKFRVMNRRDGEDVEHTGEYIEIDRPHRLVFSLFVQKYAQADDRVMIELAPYERGSLLVLTHELSLHNASERSRIESGWTATLDALAVVLSELVQRAPVGSFEAEAPTKRTGSYRVYEHATAANSGTRAAR